MQKVNAKLTPLGYANIWAIRDNGNVLKGQLFQGDYGMKEFQKSNLKLTTVAQKLNVKLTPLVRHHLRRGRGCGQFRGQQCRWLGQHGG